MSLNDCILQENVELKRGLPVVCCVKEDQFNSVKATNVKARNFHDKNANNGSIKDSQTEKENLL